MGPFWLVSVAAGLALGWPMEWAASRFPLGHGRHVSSRRAMVLGLVVSGMFGALAAEIGPSRRLIPAIVVTVTVLLAAVVDLDHRIIPNRLTYGAAPLALVTALLAQPARAPELLAAGFICTLLLGAAATMTRGGIGMGDVKLAAVIGLGIGWYSLDALGAAFFLSALYSVVLLVRNGHAALKMTMPLGPFLAAGTLLVLLTHTAAVVGPRS